MGLGSKIGLTASMRAEMTAKEIAHLMSEFARVAAHLKISMETSLDTDGTFWWEINNNKFLDGFLVGYLAALGFDDNGKRQRR